MRIAERIAGCRGCGCLAAAIFLSSHVYFNEDVSEYVLRNIVLFILAGALVYVPPGRF